MKSIFKKILVTYLRYITKLVLFLYKPKIIVIAGSINKIFIKEEIKRILIEQKITVRANPKNFNTEIGLPLSILYLPSGYDSYKNWIKIILKAPLVIFNKNFPEYLVLELGTSDPGDMKFLLSIISPQIAIISNISQRYLNSFSDMDKLVDEYRHLVKKIPKTGLLVLNNDNTRIRSIKDNAKCKIIFFGIENPSEWWGTDIKKTPNGQEITIKNNEKKKQFFIKRFGKHHVYALLAGQILKEYVINSKK